MNSGDALRRARTRAGLTQYALARRAGTSQATISAYESGRKQPSVETLDRLLAATGARLAVVPEGEHVLEPTREQLARAGRRLRSVIELAERLPVKHRPTLEFPRLPEPQSR
jgi:transcriptional regulator with XRE-family HTH domain